MKYKQLMKNWIITHLKQLHFQLLIMTLCGINLLYMHYAILLDRTSMGIGAYFMNISSIIVDVLFLFAIPLLLIEKKRYLYFIPYTLLSILVIANVWYSRYFHTYLPPSLYLEFNNLDGLSGNIYTAMKPGDLIIVVTSLIAIVYYFVFRKQMKNIKRKTRIQLSVAAMGLGGAIVIGIAASFYARFSKYEVGNTDIMEHLYLYPYRYEPNENYFKHGVWYSLAAQASMSKTEGYSEEKLAELQPLFQGVANEISIQAPQNLVLIIVESLLAYPTNRSVNGIEITPILNQLVREGAYYNATMESQIQLGESSDGQLIYMTGLLPKEKQITIIDYFDNTFMALPKLLKEKNQQFYSSMIVPTSSTMWRQDGMCVKYGFDALFSKKEYQGTTTKEWLNDKELFEYAISKKKSTPSPSFTVLLTSSTHSPYFRFYEPEGLVLPENYSKELKSYLSNVHYMDKNLGVYLEALKKSGSYDSTLIIITSDHTIHNDQLNLQQMHIPAALPLYIVNAPVKIDRKADYPMTQADVFPTILDLMGIQSKWRGVGNSLLTPDSILNSKQELERKDKRQQISDIILNSNYFSNKRK